MKKIFTSFKASLLLLAMLLSASVSVFAGTGTKEDPYTTSEVIALDNPGTRVWIKAVIIGFWVNDGEGTIKTSGFIEKDNGNVAISSDGGVTALPLQIKANTILREKLNLFNNPDVIGREILVEGDLTKFLSATGVKESTYFEFADVPQSSVATPTFSHVNGSYISQQMVEIFCETEGAKIYYTTDESEPTASSTLYTGPVAVSEATILTALAIKDEEASASSSCKLVFIEGQPITIKEFINNADVENRSILNDVVVTYQNASDIYVQDETGSLYIFGGAFHHYNPGDVISEINGKYKLNSEAPQMTSVTIPSASANQVTTPRPVTVEEQANLGFDDISSYVMLKNEMIVDKAPDWSTGNVTSATLSSGKAIRNSFRLKLKTEANTPYDITCIVGVLDGKIQFYPISIEATATGVEGISKDNSVYTSNGKVYINTDAGEEIEIYNITGQRIANIIAREGLNSISIDSSSVVLVKVGNKVYKVAL